MDSLRTAITKADDATDVASMYFEVLEFHNVLSKTEIVSQHELALDLKQKLGELEAAKEHARMKSAAMNNLQTEYTTQQTKLQNKISGRRQGLLASIQALYPVPAAAPAASAAAAPATSATGTPTTGMAAPASSTGSSTGSSTSAKK